MEKLILQALQTINEKLDKQGEVLEQHGKMLEQQGTVLDQHGKMLEQQGTVLDQHGKMLEQHGNLLEQQGKVLEQQGITLKEHGLILGALRSGQESLKAGLNGLTLQNAKEFGMLREQINDLEATIGVLKEDNWSNRKEIHRVKKKIGME